MKVVIVLIAISLVASVLVIFLNQPATSEPQTELLISESVKLSDQLSTQQKLSVFLSESVSLDDKVTASLGSD